LTVMDLVFILFGLVFLFACTLLRLYDADADSICIF
jgi:hypothetical protein